MTDGHLVIIGGGEDKQRDMAILKRFVELAGGRLTGQADVHAGLPERAVVRLRPERASKVIGLDVPEDDQRAQLAGFGFDVADDWDVTVPTWRARDVSREIDLVEEIARSVLDRVPLTLPLRRHVRGRLTKEQRLRRLVEDALVGAGLSEAYTWSLVGWDPNPDAIRLPSPMTSDQAILRTTIVPGLVEAARTGVDAGADRVALFEIARTYLPSGEQLPEERWRVAGVARTEETIRLFVDDVPGAVGVTADASKPNEVERVFADVGDVDLIVNAITTTPRFGGPIHEAPPDGLEPYMTELLPAIFNILRVGGRVLAERGRGTLVQVTGGSARRGNPGRGPWAATAFATRALVQAQAGVDEPLYQSSRTG